MHDSHPSSPRTADDTSGDASSPEDSEDDGPHEELDRLTRLRAIDSLRQLLGDDGEALWSSACAAAGTADDRPLPLHQLARVATELANQPGPIGVVGSSLSIRLRTYQMLSQTKRLDRFLGGNPDEP